MAETHGGYYIPDGTYWPIVGSIGLFTTLLGFSLFLNDVGIGPTLMIIGTAVLIFMMFGWFGVVIKESLAGLYNKQVDISFRWGMGWFIFSEVMFFAAFFGALFISRVYTVPWLGGEGVGGVVTNEYLWPAFEAAWPTNGPADIGGAFAIIPAWGVPALNTMILLTSGITVTIAHWGLKQGNNAKLCIWLFATILLGCAFLGFQVLEYWEAIVHLNLSLHSGIYGSTFFMLTGFHGAHVTIGTIMLIVILFRAMKGHFTAEHHFAFEGVAWYWHFVDVVWLGLFIFVYWL
jgi:cytochrome c oxidase subunit 3